MVLELLQTIAQKYHERIQTDIYLLLMGEIAREGR